jgi:16S rRNA A1518/A1519 N6-dimethyltransferase RsmA/KsgA/DIM1 with predicted DNA glycosylase/AP lyase activity
MFSLGEAYERFWPMEPRAKPHVVELAGVRDGDAVPDVGAGTGALTSAGI